MAFLEVLETLMVCEHLNKRQLSIGSGIPYSTIDNFWKSGYESVRLTTLSKLADYFNVSIDYLVGRSDEKHPSDAEKEVNTLPTKQTSSRDVLVLKAWSAPVPFVLISTEIDLALDDLHNRTGLGKNALACKLLSWALERTVIEPD